VINVVNLTKRFGDDEAVSALSFAINKGEIYGIVGPDGAGKSTLLRMMSTILEPDEGNVMINDVKIHDDPYAIKEKLAYMPQKFGLYEDLTVEENIYFFGRLFGLSKKDIKKREKRLYEFSRLAPFKDRLAGNLSGGMKQKLGLACCLVHNPEIILLDEPTNGVDPVSRREFWKILYDLLAEGVTIVVSTAYLDEAERCNRIAMMYGGRFITVGSPQDVKTSMKGIFIELVTTNPLLSEILLKDVAEFKGIILAGKSLRLFVDNIEKARLLMTSILEKQKINILSMEEKLPSLEDCFVDMVVKGA
jgi:ABC-2 type transport system ATP-binding protein